MKPIWVDPRLASTAFRKHRFLNETYIVGMVSSAIQIRKIVRIDDTHFEVKDKRKKNGDFVWVICSVHDRQDCYWIGKVHVEPVK